MIFMRKYPDMLKRGKVSIWTGNIYPERELLSYVDSGKFGLDFDFEIDPRMRREMTSEKEGVGVEKLVHGFSSWKAFADAFIGKATNSGIVAAKSLVVLYAFEYELSPRVNPKAPLSFVGVFDF
jgi:hypothetical protein